MLEIWKGVKGYEGIYMVSQLGRVKSLRFRKSKVMKTSPMRYVYRGVGLYRDKKRKMLSVHRLVAISFLDLDPCDSRLVVDHINNNPSDNRSCNLQLISMRENCTKDKVGGSSKYIGVGWNKSTMKWRAHIIIRKKQHYLGSFTNEIEASNAYQDALASI